MKRSFFSEDANRDLVYNINFLDCDDLNKLITLDKSSISPWGNFASLSDSLGIMHHVTRVSNENVSGKNIVLIFSIS